MIEVGLVSSGRSGKTYRWADGAESVGVRFRHITEETLQEFSNLSVLVTPGKIYDTRPHIFWLDDSFDFVPSAENMYATPQACQRLKGVKSLGPIIGPRPGTGNNLGVVGNPEINLPSVRVTDPVSLSFCNTLLVAEETGWTEGLEAACKSWGIMVVTGAGWVKPNNNWILVDPKWGWERAVREGMKKINNKAYTEALKRAGMTPTGTETLAGNVRRVLPNSNGPLPKIATAPKSVRIYTSPTKRSRPIEPPPTYQENVIRPASVINKEEYKIPSSSEISTPPWFGNENEVEVSVIVPMWRSAEVVTELVKSWDFTNTKHEIIFVNDACPHNSHQSVVSAFAQRQPTPPIGKIIALSHQSGFSTACNIGAAHARGKYLIFLNSDTTVTTGWMDALIEPLKNDSSIGIVGNLQMKADGTIDSAGSQWMWQTRSFEHIGRNVWQGNRLPRRTSVASAPPAMLADGERQMVTGCCVALENEFFKAIGGFDIKYRIGYWEDADLCMKVWDAGKRVYFTGKSRIYHRGSASGGNGHPFLKFNAVLFGNKWLDTGKLQALLKI